MWKRTLSAVAFLVLLVGTRVDADVVDAFDRGWWNSTGFHGETNQNTFTGREVNTFFNSFFVFDMGTISETIVSGTLNLELTNLFGSGGLNSGLDASETFSVYSVSTSIAELTATDTGRLDIYGDLQSGDLYGTATVTSSDVGSVISVSLSAAAIADLNAAAGGMFAIGVHSDTIDMDGITDALMFSGSDEERIHQFNLDLDLGGEGGQLDIVIPEPASFMLLMVGVGGAGWMTRRRQRYVGR